MQPLRVSILCARSAYLHRGNALAALGREDEAKEAYGMVLPMLASEPRCGRLDWERCSILVNIGNTYSRQGNFDKANKEYDTAEKLGKDHVDADGGNEVDGIGIMVVAMRARAFALKKAGLEADAKKRMKEVLELQMKLNTAKEEQKKKTKESQDKAMAEAIAAQAAASGAAAPSLVAA